MRGRVDEDSRLADVLRKRYDELDSRQRHMLTNVTQCIAQGEGLRGKAV